MFGFNGHEKDNEVSGVGNSNTAEYWQYDSRLGRRFNIDIVPKFNQSPYSCVANNPIWIIDPNGADSTLAGTSWMWEVQDGDTYESISERTGISTENLLFWNAHKGELGSGNIIYLSNPVEVLPSQATIDLGEAGMATITYVDGSHGHSFSATDGGMIYGPVVQIRYTGTNSEVYWVQTIQTNYHKNEIWDKRFSAPNLSPVEYTDPYEEGDKPHAYYNTSANYTFFDNPGRPAASTGDVYWYATLSLVIKTENGNKSLLNVTYGFTVGQGNYNANAPYEIKPMKGATNTTPYHQNVIQSIP